MTQAEEIAYHIGYKAGITKTKILDNPYTDPDLAKSWAAGYFAYLENERWF